MSYEDELEALQNEALAELEEGNNDTDTDEDQQEEPDDITDNDREDEDDGEDIEGDQEENDFEDGDELDEEEDSQDDDDDSSDSENSSDEKDSSNFNSIEVTINGQTISIDSEEELKQFVSRSAESMEEKPRRKSENEQIIEQGGLSQDDLKLLIDAKNGNKSAIAKLAKQSKVDIYDLDENAADDYESEFTPEFMSKSDEVANEIMSDPVFAEKFKSVVDTVPQEFSAQLVSDASALRNFSKHVRSGLAQQIIPEATKAKLLKGGDFMTHYAEIGRRISSEKNEPTKSKTKRKENPRAEKLKKRAANHKGDNKSTKTVESADDIWNMSDKDFKEKYGK